MNLNSEDLAAIGQLIDAALNRKFPELIDDEVLTIESAPVVNFRDGLVQTKASLAEFGPDEWFAVNLQLSGDFPEKLSDKERARVYRNTYCNADGSIAGTSAPPGVYQQGDTRAESDLLARCNLSSRVFEVVPARGMPPFGNYVLGREHLARALGVINVSAVRAQSWPDFDDYCRRVGTERRAMGIK